MSRRTLSSGSITHLRRRTLSAERYVKAFNYAFSRSFLWVTPIHSIIPFIVQHGGYLRKCYLIFSGEYRTKLISSGDFPFLIMEVCWKLPQQRLIDLKDLADNYLVDAGTSPIQFELINIPSLCFFLFVALFSSFCWWRRRQLSQRVLPGLSRLLFALLIIHIKLITAQRISNHYLPPDYGNDSLAKQLLGVSIDLFPYVESYSVQRSRHPARFSFSFSTPDQSKQSGMDSYIDFRFRWFQGNISFKSNNTTIVSYNTIMDDETPYLGVHLEKWYNCFCVNYREK